jgi:hypothetical protein
MTGAVNPNNAIMGPISLWYGAFGVTEPAQSNAALIADPGAGWTFGGGSNGGISWEIDHTITDMAFDQTVDPVGGRVTGRSGMVTFNAAEPTLAILALALHNLGTTTVGSGITTYTPGQPNAGTPLSYNAILLDGWAPLLGSGAAARRRAIFRKMLNQPKMITNGDPTKQVSWALNTKMYYVSQSIDPYIVMDQTA